jgi:hypothetical protein
LGSLLTDRKDLRLRRLSAEKSASLLYFSGGWVLFCVGDGDFGIGEGGGNEAFFDRRMGRFC